MDALNSATVPAARCDPQLRRFPLRRLRIPLGNGCLSMVVPDATAWMREGEWAAATARGAEPPYWVRIWPASIALARLLWRRGALAGTRVLDLGCGLGVPGITACRAGASVTFADVQPSALAFASWNASRQGNPIQPAVRQFDWLRSDLAETFDLLLLADVSYRPLHHAALQRHVLGCLPSQGVVVHADPVRRESGAFVRWLRDNLSTIEVRTEVSFLEKRTEVRLCIASRAAEALAPWRAAMPKTVLESEAGDSAQAVPGSRDAPHA